MSNLTWSLANRLSGVGEYYFSTKLAEVEQLRSAGADIISLGIGSPDGAPDQLVLDRLNAEAQKPSTHGYANYKGEKELIDGVATWYSSRYGVELNPQNEILTLFGSKEGLTFLMQSYIGAGDRVLVPNPGYPAYAATVRLAGGEVVNYDLSQEKGWFPDLDAIDTTGVKMMLINYPHMPTGTKPTREIFEQLVSFAKKNNIILVHDNPYSFIRNTEPLSILSIEGAKECTIELNSLSKSHNMAGWRVGFMCGNAEIIASVLRYKSNLNNSMFQPMQRAAATALSLGDEWYTALNERYFEREKIAYQIFDLLGVSYQTNQAGLFLWGRLPEGAGDCYTVCDKLLYERDLFITPGGIFGDGGLQYIRISLCAPVETLKRVVERLKDFSLC